MEFDDDIVTRFIVHYIDCSAFSFISVSLFRDSSACLRGQKQADCEKQPGFNSVTSFHVHFLSSVEDLF